MSEKNVLADLGSTHINGTAAAMFDLAIYIFSCKKIERCLK